MNIIMYCDQAPERIVYYVIHLSSAQHGATGTFTGSSGYGRNFHTPKTNEQLL